MNSKNQNALFRFLCCWNYNRRERGNKKTINAEAPLQPVRDIRMRIHRVCQK